MSNEKAWARAQRAARASYMDFESFFRINCKILYTNFH